MSELDRYVSVDIETAGPNPGRYSMLSIGACLVTNPAEEFYVELQPENNNQTEEAATIHGLDLETLAAQGDPAEQGMQAFADWLERTLPNAKPIFVAFNAPFDWMFVNDYFHRYLGRNPFGHSALDIKAYYMGRFGVQWLETSMAQVTSRVLGTRPLSHNALQDARDQAELFRMMLSIDVPATQEDSDE